MLQVPLCLNFVTFSKFVKRWALFACSHLIKKLVVTVFSDQWTISRGKLISTLSKGNFLDANKTEQCTWVTSFHKIYQNYLQALIEKKRSSRVSGLFQNYLNLLEKCLFVKYPYFCQLYSIGKSFYCGLEEFQISGKIFTPAT